jgi:hypothetical protein
MYVLSLGASAAGGLPVVLAGSRRRALVEPQGPSRRRDAAAAASGSFPFNAEGTPATARHPGGGADSGRH